MDLQLYTAPADEPLDLDQVKAHLRVDGTTEDGYLASLIAVARRTCEQRTGRQLVTQTWNVLYDSFEAATPVRLREIWLPRSPVSAVTHVKYYDDNDVQQTFSSAKYQLAKGLAPRLVLGYGQSWPSTYDKAQAVEIRVVCGYGDPEDVPEDLQQWMLLMIGHWYENREAATQREMSRLPFVDGLLDRESSTVVG